MQRMKSEKGPAAMRRAGKWAFQAEAIREKGLSVQGRERRPGWLVMSREEAVRGTEGGWKWGVTANEKRVSLWGDEHVLRLIVQLCEYTKSHSIVHFK